ncbi:hypothetical protein Q5H93_21735 [Hymenobacter sp. ASUV-10]|uniref:Uncharacterized protein n=1 Tax=Hymenobacter aranciens TaxID=3063996 RepID=A0ABT9BLF8_9BACT|nr:hypothetical protein [Hymenobacter sp. ASUV-10]MDO7877378.1 hypothetical protein [Hymenobacter sp. ASUV-10]
MDFVPQINGRAYDWASIKLQLLGQTVAGITAISYGVKQEKVNNYGAGVNPVSRGYGKREPNASITLEMKEVERIMAALPPGGSLLDIPPFPIPVAYVNASNQLITHTIMNAEFTENKREIKTGDTNIEVELPLVVSHIEGL